MRHYQTFIIGLSIFYLVMGTEKLGFFNKITLVLIGLKPRLNYFMANLCPVLKNHDEPDQSPRKGTVLGA
jgi:hypothetical protein